MRELTRQIKVALEANLYYLSLFTSLTIPDILGAIGSENGWSTKDKYIDWFDEYVSHNYSFSFDNDDIGLSGEDVYELRCSLLHQGRAKPKTNYSRIIFVEPNKNFQIHNNILNEAYQLDLKTFCEDIIGGAEEWLDEYEDTEIYEENYSKFMRRYPDGLSPYISGIPVIG